MDKPHNISGVFLLRIMVENYSGVDKKARQYGKSLNMRSQCTVGGIPISRQQKALQRGADVLIATPGRLLDLVKRGAVRFEHVEALVLDEADHMLDIGFLPDVKRIVAQLPDKRQTLLFSATMPKQIQALATEYLDNPTEVSVARTSSVAERIDQSVIHVPVRQKHNELVTLIEANREQRVVVFARTKHGSDKIVRRLQTAGIEAAAIHGNKSQGQRERALKAFAKGKCLVLIATDIAARGIDIKDVGLVVNYDLPNVPEVYVHRIGRTARAGSAGTAVSLCSADEIKHLRGIERLIKFEIPAKGEPEAADENKSRPVAKRRRPRRKNGNTGKKGNTGPMPATTEEKPARKQQTDPQKRKTGPARPNRRKRKRNDTGQKQNAA